jgi:hypothetical protein
LAVALDNLRRMNTAAPAGYFIAMSRPPINVEDLDAALREWRVRCLDAPDTQTRATAISRIDDLLDQRLAMGRPIDNASSRRQKLAL